MFIFPAGSAVDHRINQKASGLGAFTSRFAALLLVFTLLTGAAAAELTMTQPEEPYAAEESETPADDGEALTEEALIEDELDDDEADEPAEADSDIEEDLTDAAPAPVPEGVHQVTTDDGSFPALNSEGFLDEGEFVYADEKQGIWRYCSSTLKVEILRHQTTAPKMVWYEAEVFTRGDEAFRIVPYSDSQPIKAATYPDKVARARSCVFAMNTDYAHWRIGTKKKNVGVIVRNGVTYATRTVKAGTKKMPNLDVLAMYADGRMEVYESDAHTAEEYLEMGVESTLAFGPILVENGEMNQAALTVYGKARNPRTAIGMVEKGHYWAIMVEGRSKISDGANIPRLTQMMAAKGCTLALNLDGGNTSCFVFMGKQITHIGNSRTDKTKARPTAEILAVGTSSLVPGNTK